MNVFVLSTGRCGSMTFARACHHIQNFTSAHESRSGRIKHDRFNYPENHIESDNRLAWFLGRLERCYGDDAFYVHLKRAQKATASSYAKRLYRGGIIHTYRNGILMGSRNQHSAMEISLDYCDTVNTNIELFLRDKTHKMEFDIENAKQDFEKFWSLVGAEGDINASLAEFEVTHNATKAPKKRSFAELLIGKLNRLAAKFPDFVREA